MLARPIHKSIALVVFIIWRARFCGARPRRRLSSPSVSAPRRWAPTCFGSRVKKGFFDEVGLDVQPVLLRGTTITIQALASESLYLAVGFDRFPSAQPPAAPILVAVSGVVNGLTQAIVASKQ